MWIFSEQPCSHGQNIGQKWSDFPVSFSSFLSIMFHYVEGQHIDLTGSDDESVVQPVQVAQQQVVVPRGRRITGEIQGRPIPKAQPKWTRFGGRGGHGRYYCPSYARQCKIGDQMIANRLTSFTNTPGPLRGPVSVRVTFYYRATNASQLGMPYMKKPDLDNLQKLLFDAMKQADFFVDDSQVCSINASKRYCPAFGPNNVPSTFYHVYESDI